jgi:hypothetical protein
MGLMTEATTETGPSIEEATGAKAELLRLMSDKAFTSPAGGLHSLAPESMRHHAP